MMEHYDPGSHLQHWGGSQQGLSRFGVNPFGENIWRVVYAPSRRSIVRQSAKRHIWMPTYPQAAVAWVLEKWLSAYEFAKCTEEIWNQSQVGVLGPYPSRGEYELAHIFFPSPASIGHVEQMITLIEAGKRHSANENRNSMRDDLDREKIADQKYWHDRLMERTHAFGTAPLSAAGGSRGTKTREFKISAPQAGLPTKAGHIVQRQGKKRYDVSELITA